VGALIYEDLTYRIRKCLFAVHNHLGPGFREETYKQAVAVEFQQVGLPFVREKAFPVFYRGQQVDVYCVDLLAFDKIVLELKAVAEFHARFEAQLLSYLKVTQLKLGLLVNFGKEALDIRRLVSPRLKIWS